jgi:hypothetical protein
MPEDNSGASRHHLNEVVAWAARARDEEGHKRSLPSGPDSYAELNKTGTPCTLVAGHRRLQIPKSVKTARLHTTE